MTEPWHPFVFDQERRAFVGQFEAMYQAENERGFDSWHQSDPRRMDARIGALLLEEITYRRAIDLGCGKGLLTAQLKRRDTFVVGVDASPTAIEMARAHFPDVEWICAPIEDHLATAEPVDLIVAREVLSYLEPWRAILHRCAVLTRYLLVGLFLPPDPVGYVKSFGELEQQLRKDFTVIEHVALPAREAALYLVESLHAV
jgi:SAM-dependent methyltransferase